MRLIAALGVGLVFVSLAVASETAHAVRFVVPLGWQRIEAASAGPVTDPRTLLVVGTAGVRPRASRCEIASYRIPAAGAVVVVVGWRSAATAGGGALKPGRAPLKRLVAFIDRALCASLRGAVAQVLLGGKPYQVNVMVGDRASRRRVAEALEVARSFDLAR
jgi:hypothetical protein